MKQHIKDTPEFSFATITDNSSKTLTAYISTDIHGEQTVLGRAVELLYTDALISGAGKYTREQFLDAINSLGATISLGISEGVFTLYIKASEVTSAKVFSLTETMILEPHFDQKELKRIKQTVINAIKESKENTRAIAHEQLRNTIYGTQDRRYTFDEDALIKAIAKVSPKELKALHKKICSTAWTVSVATTDKTASTLEKTIKKIKKQFPPAKSSVGLHQQKTPQPTLTLRDVPSKQNIDFSIGAPVPITLHHPDLIPLMFGVAVLGKWGGFTGRLMSTVREQEGLTYGIYAKTESFYNEEQGYWRIMSFFAPDKALQGLTSTFREIKKLYKDGITEGELRLFKQILNTAQVLQNDSVASMLSDLHAYHMQKFSLQEITEHKARIYSLTVDEVNTAIRHYLNPAHLTVSGAGPVKTVEKELKNFLNTITK